MNVTENSKMQQKCAEEFWVKQLDLEEILSIYEKEAVKHFPKDELKPAAAIRKLYEEGAYEGLALYSGTEKEPKMLAGYAFYVKVPESKALLLDYYAILENCRSHGTGSYFLELMKAHYADKEAILIETELVDKAKTEEDRAIRIRRNTFYERNGCRATKVRSCLFFVDYGIYFMPLAGALSDKQVYERLEKIYRYMFAGKNYDRYVRMGWEKEA